MVICCLFHSFLAENVVKYLQRDRDALTDRERRSRGLPLRTLRAEKLTNFIQFNIEIFFQLNSFGILKIKTLININRLMPT